MKAAPNKNRLFSNHPALFALGLFLLSLFPGVVYAQDQTGKDEGSAAPQQKRSNWIILPFISYSPETKLAGGVGGMYYFRSGKAGPESRPSSIRLMLMYTQKNQAVVTLNPELYLKGEKYLVFGDFTFQKYPDKFFGIGRATTTDMEEGFTPRTLKININFLRRLRPGWRAGFLYELEHHKLLEIEPDGLLAQKNILGSEGGTSSGLGIVVDWDTRDNIFFPRNGVNVRLSAAWFGSALRSDFTFARYKMDIKRYLPLFSSHSLALQALMIIRTGDPPFQLLSQMGGAQTMRGYYDGRFRDKNVIVFQAEYRLPLFWRLGLAVFGGGRGCDSRVDGFSDELLQAVLRVRLPLSSRP